MARGSGGGGSRGGGGGRSSFSGGGSSSRRTVSGGGGGRSSSRSTSSRGTGSSSYGSRGGSPYGYGGNRYHSHHSHRRGYGYRPPRRRGFGFGSFGRRRSSGGGCLSGCSSMMGCMTSLVVVLPILIIASVVFSIAKPNTTTDGIERSTYARTKITNIASGDVLRYEDATKEGGWFEGMASDMTRGAQAAYNATGVKFGIYVVDGQLSESDLDKLANDVYDEWFGDSASHMLIALLDLRDDNFRDMYVIGGQAGTVFDDEAIRILNGYLGMYWNAYEQYSEYQMFGMALEKTAERIMSVTPTFGTTIAPFLGAAAVILVVVIGLIVFLKVKTKRDEAAADLARADVELLNTPMPGESPGWQSANTPPPMPPMPPMDDGPPGQ